MAHIDKSPLAGDRPLAERVGLAPGIAQLVAAWTPDPLAQRTLLALADLVVEMAADAQTARDELAKLRMAKPQAPRMAKPQAPHMEGEG